MLSFKTFIFFCYGIIILSFTSCFQDNTQTKQEVHLAIAYEENLAEIENSYYIQWLEEQSGINIKISFLPQDYTSQYLQLLFENSQSEYDAILFSSQNTPSDEQITQFAQNNYILPLNNLIQTQSEYLKQVFNNYTLFNMQDVLTHDDGNIYYMPLQTANSPKNYAQTMWINVDWLEQTGEQIPSTTQELTQVLTAFKQNFPNGAPLIGSTSTDSFYSTDFILNAFEQTNASNFYFALNDDNEVYFAPYTDNFRKGLEYCAQLYSEGLISKQLFQFDETQLISVCNAPNFLVGMFTAKDLSDVLSVNSPELFSNFIAIAPISSEISEGYSALQVIKPDVGAVILANSKKAQHVFKVLDIMCSEQAYLIGHFGEPNVNWHEASPGDISANGTPALISIDGTDTLLKNGLPLSTPGPYITSDMYASAVVWKGFQVNQSEYVASRASRIYEQHEPQNSLSPIVFTNNKAENEKLMLQIKEYTQKAMQDFITGNKDINSEQDWLLFINGNENIAPMLDTLQENIN